MTSATDRTYSVFKEADSKIPVFAWVDGVPFEEAAKDQAMQLARLPFIFKHVAIMPDVHAGYGSTVGCVIATKDVVLPAAVGVDIGCFSGESLVPLADGTSHAIGDLVGAGDVYVWSCAESHRIVMAKATAKRTRQNANLVRLMLDNERSLRCTPDHEFMLRDGTYRRADALTQGESMMPFYHETDKDHHHRRPVHGYNHKVVSVERLTDTEDVYCLTVPSHGNFALDAGVFVHNCGMTAVETSLKRSGLGDLEELRAMIEAAVPCGFGHGGAAGTWGDKVPDDVESEWRANLAGRYEKVCLDLPGVSHKKPLERLGTLGSGNHFVEVCVDQDEAIWIMLHSGSRGPGNRIGTQYTKAAQALCERWLWTERLPHRDLAFIPKGDPDFDKYINAVEWAQHYALKNRELILKHTLEALVTFTDASGITVNDTIACHHNYLSREHHFGNDVWVTRKGAVRARVGDRVIIPGSMGARSVIGEGLGNPDSFMSCSHGAGRTMSRTKARATISLEQHIAATSGVACDKSADTIDESPSAYKSIDAVLYAERDLVRPVHYLKQIVCIKGKS